MFTYFNPRRADLFATKFAHQIIDIKRGRKTGPLEHGNLNSVRTIIDPMEAAECYWLASLHCNIGEVYNLGGSEHISIKGVLDELIKRAEVKIETRQSTALMRPSDITYQIPDITKFKKASGWVPKKSLQESIDDFWKEVNRLYK
jgi:nucleoside-diphosphate-sugar epimerase